MDNSVLDHAAIVLQAHRAFACVPGSLVDADEHDKLLGELSQKVRKLVAVSRKDTAIKRDHLSRLRAYRVMGTPLGLASLLAKEDLEIALRVFVLDNSGSTGGGDGHFLIKRCDGYQSACSTRWEEIRAAAIEQAEWNAKAGVHSEFYLLNPPCPSSPMPGRDFAIVDPTVGNVTMQVAQLEKMLYASRPHGPTPLAERLGKLRHRLEGEMVDRRRIILTIVTDGLPTRENYYCVVDDSLAFTQELCAFTSSFNCSIVIRLATDDLATVNYYNRIREEHGLPLDILDDLHGEAKQVLGSGNGWFAYSPLVHRIREGGIMEKLFDLLDERPLRVHEIATFLEFLLRGPKDDPFPRKPRPLWEKVVQLLPQAPLVYDGLSGQMVPPVNLQRLKKSLGLTALGCMKVPTRKALRVLPAKALQAVRRLLLRSR